MSLRDLRAHKASQHAVQNPMTMSLTKSQLDYDSSMTGSADSATSAASSTPSMEDAASIFHSVDQDGDGRLVRDELEPFFNELGLRLTIDEKQDMFKSMDGDGDGEITFKEFQR